MAYREFTDSRGIEWQVWDVSPSHLHPATRGEDYMGDLQDGWLAFESAKGMRRLQAPYPGNWTQASLRELEALCQRASTVVRRRSKSPSGEYHAASVAELERRANAGATERLTFTSPRGRVWTVRLHECFDTTGDTKQVLRFTADDVVVELAEWPDDWATLETDGFARLLLDANPPRRASAGKGPQRRREDRGD